MRKKKLEKHELGKGSGESMEYALVVGLIIVAATAVVGSVGVKCLGEWKNVSSLLDGDGARGKQVEGK